MGQLKIRGRENGPYVIEGTATYLDSDGVEQRTTRTPLALCRCGESGNKPFCDGHHRKIGFKAPAIILFLDDE